MKLYICEKPSQARDIAKVLNANKKGDGFFEGNDSIITWAFGHLLEQAQPDQYDEKFKQWRMEDLPIIPRNWIMNAKKDAKKQYNVIKKLVKNSNHIVISTDADREGEVIAVELLEDFGYSGKTERLWLSALDEKSIKKALGQMKDGKETYPLYLAGLGRQRADWMVGMNLTRGMTVANKGKIQGVVSVGRVQTPTLKLVVDRDEAIENFVPRDFFEVYTNFQAQAGDYEGKWQIPKELLTEDGYLLDRSKAEELVNAIESKTGIIEKAEKTLKNEQPPLCWSLSALQKECSSKFGYGAGEVLQLAQSLYETHKATTYPRTDCQYMPNSQFTEASEVLKAVEETDPSNQDLTKLIQICDTSFKSKMWNDKKITAHHAIIPTGTKANIAKMSAKEQNVYKLIRDRYIAQFLGVFEYEATEIITKIDENKFKTTGKVPKVKGWKVVYEKESKEENDSELPNVSANESVAVKSSSIKKKMTKPPARFTDGTLIEAMKNIGKMIEDPELKKVIKETSGIGTEATRANIIDTLYSRNYIEKEGKKALKSSNKGRALIKLVPNLIKEPATTALWEQALDDVASKQKTLDEFLKIQSDDLNLMLKDIVEGKCTSKETIGSKYKCPECGSALLRRKGKFGYFWGCTAYPQCDTMLPDSRGKPGKPKEKVDQGDGEHFCQDCDRKIVRRKSKMGKFFWGCTGFSDKNNQCKSMYTDNDGLPGDKIIPKEKETSDYKCPKCKTGHLLKRSGAKGDFWGCNAFPKCKTTLPDDNGKPGKPKEKETSDYKCPKCKTGHLLKRSGAKGDFWGCNAFPKCKTTLPDDNGKPGERAKK